MIKIDRNMPELWPIMCKECNFEISFIVWIAECFEKTTWSRILFLWGVAPYHRAICSRHFKGTHCLHLRGSSQAVCSIEMSGTACPPSDAASYPRRTDSSPTLSWRPQHSLHQVTTSSTFVAVQPHIGWVGVHSEVLKCMFMLHYVTEVPALLKDLQVFVLWSVSYKTHFRVVYA